MKPLLKWMIEYSVLTARNLEDEDLGLLNHSNIEAGLISLVKEALLNDWRPQGGVHYSEGIWMQAVIRGCCKKPPTPTPVPEYIEEN